MDSVIDISIIIPIYNVKDYIEETLNSILNQSFKNYEVIIVNDGSTDGTDIIIERIKPKFKRIKVINQANSGPSIARNKGIEAAKGEYIIFVDADDILPKDSLKIRYKEIKEQNVDIVIGKTKKFNKEKEWDMGNQIDKSCRINIYEDLKWVWTLGPCNKIFSRKVIKNIEFPTDLKYGEDQIFVMKAILKANYIYYSNKVIYLYREREIGELSLTNQTRVNAPKVLKQIRIVWESIERYICENVQEEKRDKFLKMYFKRLICSDIWPALFIGIENGDGLNTLNEVNNIVCSVKSEYINNLSSIKVKTINLIKNKEIKENYRGIIRKVMILNTIPKIAKRIKRIRTVFK